MEAPAITVNGEVLPLTGWTRTPPRWTGCARAASPAPRKAAPRVSAAPARPASPARGVGDAHRVDGDQRLPDPGRRPRRPGGRHRRGPRHTRGAAPGAARDGGPRRVAVRLLHAGVRLQHGGGVLPRRPPVPATAARGTASRHRSEHGPNGFDLHALSGNLCRCTGYRPIRDAAYALGTRHRLTTRWPHARAAPAPAVARHPASTESGDFVRPADLAEALAAARRRTRTRWWSPARTDWGVEVNLRGRARRLVIAVDRLRRAARPRRSATTRSRSAPRSRSPRSSAASTAGCRC